MTTSAPEVPTIGGPDEAKRAKRLALTERATYLVCAGLGALSLIVIALIAVFVFRKAWPAFSFNGIHFFGYQANPNLDQQLNYAFTGHPPGTPYETLRASPGDLRHPPHDRRVDSPRRPVLHPGGDLHRRARAAPRRRRRRAGGRLLAAVPSVICGLFGLLVIAPVIKNIFISTGLADEYVNVVPLQGQDVLLGTLVLTLMVAPFEIAIFTDALRSVPSALDRRGEGARHGPLAYSDQDLAAGDQVGDRRGHRPRHRAGDRRGHRPLDDDRRARVRAEPARRADVPPRAGAAARSAIIDYSEGFSGEILAQNLFAFGALIMVSAFSLMLAARLLTHGRGKASGAF